MTRIDIRAELLPAHAAATSDHSPSPSLIGGLYGSPVHRLAVDVYLRHRDAGNGVCGACGCRMPCVAGRNARAVIEAAGEDPSGYRGLPAHVTGWHLGGVGRRGDVPYMEYGR
jgi:hypothetical protein